MNNFSYWEYKHFWANWDFLVIGSGITGLASAIFLKKRNKNAKIAILEKGVLPTGASTKNAGFACFGSISEINSDLDRMSEDAVFSLISKRYKGIHALRNLLSDERIGFKADMGYELFRKDENEEYEKCLGSLAYINNQLENIIGMQTFWDANSKIDDFGFKGVDNMIVNKAEGSIDTGLMMKNLVGLARNLGIEIFNGIEVKSIESTNGQVQLETSLGETKCRNAIIATNGFAKTLLPELKVQPARAQVLITSKIKKLYIEGTFHHNAGYNYFRNIDNRMLIGGGRHLNFEGETTDSLETTKQIQDYLEGLLRDHIIPNEDFTIENRWAGIMGLGNSKEIIFKEINANIVCAVRLGGMGVAIGTKLGMDVCDLISPSATA